MEHQKPAIDEGQMKLIKDRIENPSFEAGMSLFYQNADGTANGYALSKEIQESVNSQIEKFKANGTDAAIDMLVSQIVVLDASFHELYSDAVKQPNYAKMNLILEMALRCQEQSRKTLKTLNEIQNPKPKAVFIKNALIQQLNKLENRTQELQKQLEAQPYGQVEFGSKAEAEREDESTMDKRTP